MELTENKVHTSSEGKPFTEHPKVKDYYLDDLIDGLDFSRFNLSIIFICILTNINDGYLSLYFKFNEINFLNQLTWTSFDYQSILVGQNFLYGLGAIFSIYARTTYWDVSSNSLIAIVEFLSTLMLLTYSDTLIYKLSLVFYCFCQGYLSNLSTNYLLEISPKRYRGVLFVFVCGCRFLGQAIFGLVVLLISNASRANDPNILIVGLVVSTCLLSISCLYLTDSPRVLFYNNDTVILIHFLKEMINDEEVFDIDKQKKIHLDLDTYKNQIKEFYEKQEIKGHLHEYPDLFIYPGKHITYKGLFFSFFCIVLITNVTELYPALLKEFKFFNDFLYYKVNYEVFLNRFVLFIWFALFSLLMIAFEIRKIVITTVCLFSCIIVMVLIICLKSYFTLLIQIYEAFSFLFFFLIYLHYSEYTTTRLRNSFTSLFYFMFSLANSAQYFSIMYLSKVNTFLPIYINFGLCFLLIILNFGFNSYTTSDKGLNEIELAIYDKKIN